MNCCCRHPGPTYPLMRRVRDGKLQTFSSDFVNWGRAEWNGEIWTLAHRVVCKRVNLTCAAEGTAAPVVQR
jgi:hypothetical protein